MPITEKEARERGMKNFCLIYRCYFNNEVEEKSNPGAFQRVITAKDYEFALQIAHAMEKEEVYCYEYIIELVSFAQTKEEARLSSWGQDYTWRRVFEKLGLNSAQYDFILSSSGEKVGIIPKATA